ncbi:MAG: glutamate synthase subunit beta [Deltaproteobacteria bacterium]|nr:glutamate synthase subunit beta [Deltaproteobacteria bacterium]
MGQPTGFIEFSRVVPLERRPRERVADFRELHSHLPESTMREQGARCMDCGVPFCHAGKLVDGLTMGCPLHNLIPEWNDLIYRGRWREAIDRLHRTNNFPEVTGRVCPAPCEGSCVLGINAPPVTIKVNECAIADRAFREGWVTASPPSFRTGKRVAVVGSGPAGLACAAELNRAGHDVTVFERADRIGGLMTYGIPAMKLDKSIVERRVKLLADEGVRFVTNTEVGKSYPTERLRGEFDAIALCGGATVPRDLPVPGRQLGGVRFAMEFLTANTRRLLDGEKPGDGYVSARDKNVIVIGGGDTGTDCVGTALRHGCKSLVQLELLPRPPDTRAADNPWPQWPKIYRVDYGQEEAAAAFGQDPRQFQVQTKRMLDDGAGQVRAIEVASVRFVPQISGPPKIEEVSGSERILPADLVLLAMGFVGPEKAGLLADLGVRLDARGNVATDANKQTSVPGVFAAGDMARGQSLVVWAIAEGRDAAVGIDRFLMGETVLE